MKCNKMTELDMVSVFVGPIKSVNFALQPTQSRLHENDFSYLNLDDGCGGCDCQDTRVA